MNGYNKITKVRGRVASSIVSKNGRVKTPEKVQTRQEFFRRLFKFAPCYLVNTVQSVSTVQEKIREIIRQGS